MYHKQNEIQHLEIKYEPRKIVCEWFLPVYPSLSLPSPKYIYCFLDCNRMVASSGGIESGRVRVLYDQNDLLMTCIRWPCER